MIPELVIWWSLIGVALTIAVPPYKMTKREWIIVTAISGPIVWLAMLVLYALKTYCKVDYTFWR